MQDGPPVFDFGGFKTLPMHCVMARTLEDIQQFGKGQVRIECTEPDYDPPSYGLESGILSKIATDPNAAISAINEWRAHLSRIMYFVQLKDDPTRRLIKAFHDHTELISTLCDARLGIDSSELWKSLDWLFSFECVHSDYRADGERDAEWADYAVKSARAFERLSEHSTAATRSTQRMIKQIELKASDWNRLSPIGSQIGSSVSQVSLFFSYSHKDEHLRDQLETHLALLKRQGTIAGWHDRRISAGREWEGQIDANLNAAKLILLLVSSDFLASDYCYDIEAKRALERHNAGDARVVPIILRACDWTGAPFGKLQALPKDARPVDSWQNKVEAFTDVAKGIRVAVHEMRVSSAG